MPKNTPKWLVWAVFLIGGCLGLSIGVTGLLALYGVYGFVGNMFFVASLDISPHQAEYLGAMGLVAAIACVLLSFLAYDMNVLTRRSIALSKIVWLPLVLTAIMVWWARHNTNFTHRPHALWLAGAAASIILGGILPWLLLRTKAAQKLHNRP